MTTSGITRRLAGPAVLFVLGVGIVTTSDASAGSTEAWGGFVTLRHAPSGFSIQAPSGYRLGVSKGVYVLKKGGSTLSFSRSVTSVTPSQFGGALLAQLRGRVVSRGGDGRQFTGQVNVGNRREAFVVTRNGPQLTVTTGSSPAASPLSLGLVRQVGASAKGGFALRAPAQTQTRSIALGAYRAPDGGATALVPTDPSWTIESTQGAIQGSSAKGSFIFGFSINIFLPGSAPANSGTLISPYLYAANALTQFFPRLAPTVSNIRITKLLKDAALPSFTSSGMFLIDYQVNGKPWTGAVTVGTDSPDRYGSGNFIWNFYYSGIGVPVGSDPSVGVGLLKAWKSWNPSGAIAARTQAAAQLINETNEIWQQTSEFRSRTADRQSRDVGCLLQGYYVIEDNSRKYDLPSLPCGQIYTERP